jgi:hypothetical protein
MPIPILPFPDEGNWSIPEQPPGPAPQEGAPEAPPPEEAPALPQPPGRRKTSMYNGREYYWDGRWLVDKEAVDSAAAAAGIDAGTLLEDPRFSDLVIGNRISRRDAAVKDRMRNVAAWNDANWTPGAKEAGFGNWRAMRKALVDSPAFKALPQSEQEYLWQAGPGAWVESGILTGRGAPQAPPTDPAEQLPPPPTNRPAPTGPIYSAPRVAPTTRPVSTARTAPTIPVPSPTPYSLPAPPTTKPFAPPATDNTGIGQFPGGGKIAFPKLKGLL